MKNWIHLNQITKRRMLQDLTLALGVSVPAEGVDQRIQRLERVVDLYDGLGTLRSTMPRGVVAKVMKDRDILATLNKWRNEIESLKHQVNTQTLANIEALANMPDEEGDYEPEDPAEDPDETASLGDTRADQQYVEYGILLRRAELFFMKDPSLFATSDVAQRCIDKFITLALVAQEQVLREARAALAARHRRLRSVPTEQHENIVLAWADFVDRLTGIHNTARANRTS